jgi:hypothetical protein
LSSLKARREAIDDVVVAARLGGQRHRGGDEEEEEGGGEKHSTSLTYAPQNSSRDMIFLRFSLLQHLKKIFSEKLNKTKKVKIFFFF